MRRLLVAAVVVTALLAPASPAQDAPIYYGGGVPPTLKKSGHPVALARSGTSLTGVVALTVGCRRFDVPETIIGVKGAISGDTFSAHGGSRVVKGLRVQALLTG